MTQLFARTSFGPAIDLEDDLRGAAGNREKAALDDPPVGHDHRGGPFGALVWLRANERKSPQTGVGSERSRQSRLA